MESSKIEMMYDKAKPFLGVIFLQFGYSGMAIIGKFALNQGMSHYTLVVYRHALAAAVIAPFAFFLDRKVRPPMTISTFIKILLLGLLEPVIDQNLYYMGMKNTTATFTAAMCNILPAITFIMAWICRLEKVNLRKLHSQAKVVGTIATVGGAMFMTLMRGPVLDLPWTSSSHHHQSSSANSTVHDQQNPIKGALMISTGCICWACFFILQAITLKAYPAQLSLSAWICSAGMVEGAILALVMERGNASIWVLKWDATLLAVLYGGIINSGVGYFIQGAVMKERGPVFVTSFNPLCMVIVAIMGSFILSEQMYLGRIIGAIIIVSGLYLVVWGKSKDQSPPKSNGDQRLPDQQPMAVKNNSTGNTSPGFVAVEIAKEMPSNEPI
ncbi:WAT1-related protein At2g39510 [Malania oleifera]|uniref:WAT1-related protein At2g39510 n=1 Tax=Malania oleifera TaxID=397392 RepID=UPI0025AE7908|nr:WAT1-related protein At2g39510 [Malania oleifera]